MLQYQGKYYTLTNQRIPYRRDKTEDERFFILSLFAIAYEIEACGQYTDNVMKIQLAIGLPPAHFGVQAKKFTQYFMGRGAVRSASRASRSPSTSKTPPVSRSPSLRPAPRCGIWYLFPKHW